MSETTGGRRWLATAAMAGVTAVLAACGSSGPSGSSGVPSATSTAPSGSTPATSTAPASTLAPPKGDPIVIAMIAQESGPAALPDSRLAAEAAVKYVNTELGGTAGRPLQLETCVTDGSPEQSSACANQLLEKHPVAFVGESELGTAGSVPIIEKAGVPLVGAAGVTPELVLSQDALRSASTPSVTGPGGRSTSPPTGRRRRSTCINLDIPAAPVFEKVVRSVAEANGAKVGKVVSLPLSATDVTAQMAAAPTATPT